ncbi:hypothetical protein [Salegentibacter chungangensis]|uniref:Uncharacterized protein n=1 Tax=Salegentibacter chungangensis TaxID=1335724 RepID=A0ABW3NUP6_9FLAO
MKRLILKPIIWIVVISAFSIKTINSQNLEFNTDGLYNAELLDNIFRGHFENIQLNRDDTEFFQLYAKYLRVYGERCDKYLPTDKEMIMDDVCDMWKVQYNGYGVEINRYCVQWNKEPSNIYARRDLYEAQLELESFLGVNFLRELSSTMNDQNAIGNSVDKLHKAKALLYDMSRILSINPCDSPGLRRFEENLKAFALNMPSIRMAGESKYTAMKKSGGPTGPQDFNRLIDDLVTDQARTWAFNRYRQGSINGVSILSEDNQGRPLAIKADYRYSGFGGDSGGWVKITFSNGLPNGIYFFDFPNNRKSPSSSIVASYAQGEYGK